MMYRLILRTLCIGVLALGGALGQSISDPVESIFRPSEASPTDTPVPLLPAAPRPQRMMWPRLPPFELKTGDRVLLLGDSLFEREAEFGYLETRLSSQSPAEKPLFRNLSWSTNTPLAQPDAARDAGAWLAALLAQAAKVKPTTVLLGYGTAASAGGDAGLAAFGEDCRRLRDALRDLDTNVPVRFVWFSPMFHESATPPPPDLDPRNAELMLYAQAIYEIATNRQDLFVPAFDYLRMSAAMAEARGRTSSIRMPRHMEDGFRLTPYGCSRVVLAMERGLRWPATNWRFGLLPDATLRPGGFGAEVVIQRRTDEGALVSLIEERLPSPNVAGFLDLAPDTKPQCYIQMPGFKPGRYELRVDGQKVVVGTESDWARYMVISEGPSWDQAEQLRQAIVAKNVLVTERWRGLDKSLAPTGGQPVPALFSDPQIGEWEAKIHRLQQTVRRKYEVVRIDERPSASVPGSAPAPGK